MTTTKKSTTRRKFIKGGAIAAGAGASTLAFPNIATAAPRVLKVQAAWGGGAFLDDAKNYVARVNAMAGKDLKIDLLSVIGLIVILIIETCLCPFDRFDR